MERNDARGAAWLRNSAGGTLSRQAAQVVLLSDSVAGDMRAHEPRDVTATGRSLGSLLQSTAGIAATMALCTLGAVLATNLIDRGHWEQAVICLTTESEWPFHDVHLATAAGQLDDPSLVAEVRAAQGISADEDIIVELDGRRQSGNGTLTISARADSSATAAVMANAVAEAVLDAVPADTPIRLVDRADEDTVVSTATSVAGSGALVGLLIGIVIWAPLGLATRAPSRAH